MEQTGNCGKVPFFSAKEELPSHRPSLLTTPTSLTQAGQLSPLARNRKCKGKDLSNNQAQFSPTRGNSVLPSLL